MKDNLEELINKPQALAFELRRPPRLKRQTIFLFLFSLMILAIRLFLRGDILEIDEAEQMVLAQQLLAGYPEQPPLYSWLQYGVFALFGHHLVSIALLKSLLIFGCLYYYHQICELHCQSSSLAWCATIAWVLMPAISLDLIKDNTHSVLVLFAACLTWYWFLRPSPLSKTKGYLGFACVLAIGFLSKFNYLLFLALLTFCAMTVQEYRQKLLQPAMLFTLLLSLIIASPYFVWLITNQSTGFHGYLKLIAKNKSLWNGLSDLVLGSLFFVIPCFTIAFIAFPIKLQATKANARDTLLNRFMLFCLPFLAVIVFFGGINHFSTRWLIPLFFLTPVFYFSKVKMKKELDFRIKAFLICGILTELVFLLTLVYRSYVGNNIRSHFPLLQVTEILKKQPQKIDYIVSDSFWLIGNLMLKLSVDKGWLLHPALSPQLPLGHSLVIWQTAKPPIWADYFVSHEKLENIKTIEEPQDHHVIAGFAFAARSR